jgi:hypothetical protein
MELEETVDTNNINLPIFPMALSVVKEKLKELEKDEKKIVLNEELSKLIKNKMKILKSATQSEQASGYSPIFQKRFSVIPHCPLQSNGVLDPARNKVISEKENEENDSEKEIEIMAKNVYGAISSNLVNTYEEVMAVKPVVREFKEENYMVSSFPEMESETMDVPEAEETMQKMQYAALLVRNTEIREDEKRKMNWFIMTNPAIYKFIESKALTRDVNYQGY